MNGLSILGLWAMTAAGTAVVVGWAPLSVWLETHDKLAAWAQAIGSIAAIVAGAAAVWWQVHRQAALQAAQIRAEEVRRLQIVGAAVFDCSFSAFVIAQESESTLSVKSEIGELRSKLATLATIGPLDLPDWRAGFAIASAVRAFENVVNRLSDVPDLHPDTHDRRMSYINVITDAFEFAEGLIRECLQERGADVLPISHSYNGTALRSMSYMGMER